MSSPDKTKYIQKQRKDKKHKEHKQHKDHKYKKQKRDKKHKRDRESNTPQVSPSHQDRAQVAQPQSSMANSRQHSAVMPYGSQKAVHNTKLQQQQPMAEYKQQKTHVNCRRCKELTFSLKTRTCQKCGYPKQERPKYFPTTKEVNVLDLVKQGKLVHNSYAPVLIQVTVNDRFGKKQRIKCCPSDTIFELKKLISAQTGTRPQKIRLQKANIIFKDQITLDDYEIKDGTGLQMYYD